MRNRDWNLFSGVVKSFYVPVNNAANITSYAKWEQAFRVYSSIYTKAHAHRSCELIEYNHVMDTVAQHYIWDNVYMYNKDFCISYVKKPVTELGSHTPTGLVSQAQRQA